MFHLFYPFYLKNKFRYNKNNKSYRTNSFQNPDPNNNNNLIIILLLGTYYLLNKK